MPASSKFGAGFWMLLFFAVLADIFTILCDLSVIFFWIPPITNFVMNAVVVPTYLFMAGIPLNGRKAAAVGVASVLGELDLPTVTLNLAAIRLFDAAEEKLLGKSKPAPSAPPGPQPAPQPAGGELSGGAA